jgi:hypothetical protein
MEGQGAIYNSFYTILTYFFPPDIVTQYSQVFVTVAVVSVLAFAYWVFKSIKKLLGGN